jgi:hypothetical protein
MINKKTIKEVINFCKYILSWCLGYITILPVSLTCCIGALIIIEGKYISVDASIINFEMVTFMIGIFLLHFMGWWKFHKWYAEILKVNYKE